MSKIYGIISMIIGTALLAAALSLVFYNLNEDKKSWESAQGVLDEMKAEMPDPFIPTEPPTYFHMGGNIFEEYEKPTEPPIEEEPTLNVLGNGYIGYISLPDLGIELPVMYEWNYPNLRTSPCRYKGTVNGNDLIIAAHNYRSHFGRLNEYSGGEIIYFIEANGAVHTYEVSEVTEINGKDVDAMDFGGGRDWDLTLFTCTLGGQSRVTIRAVMKGIDEIEEMLEEREYQEGLLDTTESE